MEEQTRAEYQEYVRNFVFGVEDSVVSTVGLVSGIAVAGVPTLTIILTGTVLIFVEAFSMGVGSFLSDSSAEEYKAGKEVSLMHPVLGALVMFFSYFFSGFIVLIPYLIFEQPDLAVGTSVATSLAALFLLGTTSARFSGMRFVKKGAIMFFMGGAAILIGIMVGKLLK